MFHVVIFVSYSWVPPPPSYATQGGALGKIEFILHSSTAVAQGNHKSWIQRHSTSVWEPPAQWREMCAATDERMRTAVIKTLDRGEGAPSWRFWARLVSGILPTMSRMAKFAASGTNSAYHKVYGGVIHTTWAGTHNRLCRTFLFILC